MERHDLAMAALVVLLVASVAICYSLLEAWQRKAREVEDLKDRILALEAALEEALKGEIAPEAPESPQETGAGESGCVTATPGGCPATGGEMKPDTTMASAPAYTDARGYWLNEVWADQEQLRQRVYAYARGMGIDLPEEEMRYYCDLASWHGYDPRLWVVMAVAESSGGKGSGNIYGFCGGPGSPWARPGGGWREQTEWLDNCITTFYAQYVDISDPAQVLWFHHEGEPLAGRDPYTAGDDSCDMYIRNIMTWLEAM